MSSSSSRPADWQAVRSLFEAALALPPAAREAHVRAAAVAPEIAAEVLSLLMHSSGGSAADDEFLAQPAALGVEPPLQAGSPGLRLGPWSLVALLGSGGMGEVWQARRADGAYDGEAAVKLLKRGMDSAAVLQRFAEERQALARLEHPHIARLLDAGLSPQGLPYFVMERVHGLPIDRALAGRPLEQRLQVFLQLCDAVAYAHRQLLVHRDLKPGNVLVDGNDQVKLLDFGIAKALEPGAGDVALTQTGLRPFTPSHASPEQVRGEPVGTATDVYALGVLLYQLLTGQRPYGRAARTPAEAAQAVLDEAPTRPSTLTPQDAAVEAPVLRERLKGDLDQVLLKALQKEPADRYASVDAFAADLRAFLGGYPVSAQPPRRAYLLAKFLRRNRLPAALSATAVMALAGGLAATAWQARAAQAARDHAQLQLTAVKGITADLVFRFGDSLSYLPGGPKAQDALLVETERALVPLSRDGAGDPALVGLQAALLSRRAELRLNDTTATPALADEGRALLERAIRLGEAVWATQLRDWRFAQSHGRALQLQGSLWRQAGRHDEALARIELAVQRLQAAQPFAQHDVGGRAAIGVDLANLLIGQGQVLAARDPEAALQRYLQAEPVYRRMLADTAMHAELDAKSAPGEMRTLAYLRHQQATLLGSRALALLRLERLDDARDALTDALRLRQANVADDPRNLAFRDGLVQESNSLALVQLRLGDDAAALQAARLSWETCQALAREQGPNSKWAVLPRALAPQYGRALLRNGQAAQALGAVEAALASWQSARASQAGPALERRLAQLRLLHAELLAALDRRDAALQEARDALQAYQALQGNAILGRDAQLGVAEAAAWLWQQAPMAERADWREQARAALANAAAQRPLGADHAALAKRLGA